MPNLTPMPYRRLYQIYPAKACLEETADAAHRRLRERLAALGRQAGCGQGSRKRVPAAAPAPAAQVLQCCER